jgi:Arc/MetJ family transcription regulator
MGASLTSIRLDKNLADEVKAALGVRTRTEAVHIALEEMARLNRFKKLMKKYGGKLQFANYEK